MRLLIGCVGCATLVLLAAGCGREEDLGPPAIAYGAAECELCKMIISEERFAAAAVIRGPRGVTKVAFDDVGCLLDFLRDESRAARVFGFVHDYGSQHWIDADRAVFVHSDSLHTPMASHLAACDSSAAATELLRQFPGAVVEWDRLLAAARVDGAAESLSSERSSP
ncbi:MAG: nitrous oxide reductase accessory protein NosL [Phycisphaerae bacterium]